MKPQIQGDVQDLSPGSRIVTAIQGRPVANTPPAASQVIGWSSSNKQWTPTYPPGYEIGYDQITAAVFPTATASSTANTVIAGSAYSFDGAPVLAEFFSPQIGTPTGTVGASIAIGLYESTTLLEFAVLETPATGVQLFCPFTLKVRFTPSSGKHTYSIKAWVSTGTGEINAGSSGGGSVAPAFLRFTKV